MSSANKNKNAPAILIVDDDASIRMALDRIITTAGYNSIVASSGQKAIEIVEKTAVQLVLLDIRMKGMDGIDTLRVLKEIFPGLVVIMLTAYGTLDTARKAMEYGAYDYVTKPFDVKFLIDLIKQGLEKTICEN